MNPLLVLAAALLVIAVGTLIWLWRGTQSRERGRLAALSSGPAADASAPARAPGWQGVVDRVPTITRVLQQTSIWEQLQLQILRAGWLLRPSELVAVICGAGLVGAAVGLGLSGRWGMGAFGLLIGGAIPYIILKVRQSQRAKALNAQIPDALDMLASALRAGFAFMRGLQLIASQMHPPISEEFARVVEEVQFGVSVNEALDNLIRRTSDYDLELVVSAVQTQLEIGGNLAEILDNIAGMVRERVKLSGEVATASAEGRMSASILLALPVGVAFMLNLVNPGYMDALWTSEPGGPLLLGFPAGPALLCLGVGLMLLGALIIKKLIAIDI